MQDNSYLSLEDFFSRLTTVLKAETFDSLLQAVSGLKVNEDCKVITLRQCHINSYGIPILGIQTAWTNNDVAVWQNPIVVDDDSLAKVWILGGGPPIFIENFEEFALFTDSSRKFYLEQGVTSLYRIMVRRDGQYNSMLSVMWTSPQTFSAEYKAIIEFLGWVLLPVLENIFARQENERLTTAIVQLEQKILETESRIHILAHDLKQPLSSIMTTASMLTDYIDQLSKEQIASKLERVLQTSKGMNDWISSILLLAQARSEQEIELTDVQMLVILSDVVNSMQELITNSSAQINYHALATDTEILGQPTWIAHIWINLISNACKYGGSSPIITISADSVQNMVRFTIRDNGPGIPPNKLNLVFEPFSRFAPDKPGTGIGLTTVKMLIEKMGGNIGVESDSTGTNLWFTLRKSCTLELAI